MEKNNFKHGYYKTRLYVAWSNMKHRCYYLKDRAFKNYGGRGITVCDEWKNDFKVFLEWSLLNGYSDSLTIDRINVNGNYEPSNCRWITNQKQQLNRTNNRNVTYNSVTKTLSEWAIETGIAHKTLENRLNYGWSVKDAFETPVQTKKTTKSMEVVCS